MPLTKSPSNTESNHKAQIVIKKVFKQEATVVWDSITSKEALSNWLMKTDDFELKVGHRFLFTTEPRGNFDGKINCQIISFTENEELSYFWKAADMIEPTIVRWSIQEIKPNETFLQLEHYGFQGFKGWLTRHFLNMGWKKLLSKKLQNYLSI